MKNNELSKIFETEFNNPTKSDNKIETNILMDYLANEWIEIAKKLPNPEPLFGSIWHQGEVGILFSNTGKGKSILGFQLAEAISSGNPILGQETVKQKAIYFDFELSSKAFQQRYTNETGETYKFNENFVRVEIDRNKEFENEEYSFEDLIIESIKHQVEKNNAEVIFIDNITFLSAQNERSKEALALMKLILEVSRKRNLAILLIAHTPKRDIFKPIQLEDLAGSKALSNFTDVVFCIGESIKGSNIRYIKQLKNRNYPIEFHENNVMECEVVKENSFLQFKFIDFNTEDEHLKKAISDEIEEIQEILKLKNQGLSNVEIGRRKGVSETAIRRRLKKYNNSTNGDEYINSSIS